MKNKKVLFISTSHDIMEDAHASSGVWLEELAAPYYVFKDAGVHMTIASSKGGPIPIDSRSQSIIAVTRDGKRFLKDPEAMLFLNHSILLEEINAGDFDIAFLPGGHGAMWDIAGNKIVKELLETFNNSNKLIGLVSHGVAGLLTLLNDKGDLLIKGKRLTAFSNSEEEATGLTKQLPFLLETELISLGALYNKGANYTSFVVTDGNIVTGQNPASAANVARKIDALSKNSLPVTATLQTE